MLLICSVPFFTSDFLAWLCRLAFVLFSDGILDFHGEPTQPCRRRTEQVRVLQAIIDFFGCDVVLYTGVCIIGRGNYFYGVRLPPQLGEKTKQWPTAAAALRELNILVELVSQTVRPCMVAVPGTEADYTQANLFWLI